MCRALLALLLVMASSAQLAAAKLASYREPPYGACRYVQDQFHITPDPWQEEALVAWVDPTKPRISLQAAAGVGKTGTLAWCGWHFLSCYGEHGHHPKGFVTGITHENLRDNLWAEFDKWRQVSPYLTEAFRWTSQRIFAAQYPSTWFLAPRNWPKTGNADQQGATLSGLHGKYVAALIDESGAIPSTVLRAAEQALADRPAFGKVLQAGNPISLDGMLYAAANQLRAQWTIVIVNNDPDDARSSPRGDKEWARLQILTYGRENPWVKAYILGKFPEQSLNTLLSIDDVEKAMERRVRPDAYNWAQKRIGVDVARFGDDRSVLFPRQGIRAFAPISMRAANTVEIAARVFANKQRWKSQLELIDDTGHFGHGVIDNLRASGITSALPVVFSDKALNPRYRNRRAEMWIEMTQAVKRHLQLPRTVPDLVAELTTPQYTFANGMFMLEEKDQVKKRLGRSPDLADALALTFALPDMPNEVLEQMREQGRGTVEIDYDPFNTRQ